MRVTGGKARGTNLKTLPRHSIRPTTNVVRQAIFAILENSTASWDYVLDLYAGSGALGIEALSRGAGWVDFVDYRKGCCDIIRANLGKVSELGRAHIYCCTVDKALTFLSSKYDIIFMDPPYAHPSTNNLLTNLAKSNLLGENAAIIVCHANRFPLNPDYDGLHLIKQLRHGDTFIFMYQKEV